MGLWFRLVLLAAILIGIDVVLRKLFNTSIGGADELAGYRWRSVQRGPFALLDRAHIHIGSLTSCCPGCV